MPPGFELTTKSSASKETNAWWQGSRPINVPPARRRWEPLSRLNGTCAWISPYRVRTCNVSVTQWNKFPRPAGVEPRSLSRFDLCSETSSTGTTSFYWHLMREDARVLSEVLRREVGLGKIVYGENYATLKVKTSALASEVRKLTDKIGTLLASPSPPELVLNRHCAECEFQNRCRQKAIEKDDLSLLSGMTEKERTNFNSKGIFTVTQLSHTFRPRRRPQGLRDKRERYHHSLKALAIREKKIHVIGSPEMKIEGTPVYVDVEGLPD